MSDALRSAAEIQGWDWSPMRDRMEPFGWSYPELLAEYVGRSVRTLDVGTGGGEIFSVAARPQDVALDIAAERLTVARTLLACSLVRANYEALPVPSRSFDLVTDRHVGAPPHEVLRALEPGGVYLTQQPGGHICQNIFDAMGWGSNEEWWQRHAAEHGYTYRNIDSAAEDYERAGCRIIRRENADVLYEFLDEESLAFWLANAPLPEIDIHAQADALDALPLQTNWHAELLIVQKPISPT